MFTKQSLHVALEAWGVIFCLIAALCLSFGSKKEGRRTNYIICVQIVVACYLLADALAWLYRGMAGPVGYWIVRISNCCVFIIALVITIIFHLYLCNLLFAGDWKTLKKIVRVFAVLGICAIGIVLVIISQFTDLYYYFDENNFYHRNTWHTLHMCLALLALLLDLSLILQYRKRLSKNMYVALLSYFFLPFIATIIQIFYYGISLVNFAVSVSTIFIFVTEIVEQSRTLTQKEEEVYEMRANMMLSQIRPHFIYNTLTIIKHLCKKDPDMAAETVDEFANYLRGNLESLSLRHPISFEQELNHVKNYLAIEKKRFGDLITVEYHIEDTNFRLPALTLQPIVENAVKHGIRKRMDGGTIRIYSKKEERFHVIRVVDDGVGFEQTDETEKEETSKHTGIENVRARLEYISSGTLMIQSKKGFGTTVEICIPIV